MAGDYSDCSTREVILLLANQYTYNNVEIPVCAVGALFDSVNVARKQLKFT